LLLNYVFFRLKYDYKKPCQIQGSLIQNHTSVFNPKNIFKMKKHHYTGKINRMTHE
jgi:hypothetical protein